MKRYEKYKDSGVEWIGEIPAHWEVKKLKYVVSEKLQYGANEPAEFEEPADPRYIRITDFGENGKLRIDTFKSLPSEKAKEYLLTYGDILFARSGATVGKTFQFKNYEGVACYAGYLIKVSPDKKQILSDFLYAFTKSGAYENWKNSIFNQATIQNIGADKYNFLQITVPPLSEQTAIANYLDEKTAQIDKLVANKQKLIALLKEERTAIINQAVTKGLNYDSNDAMKTMMDRDENHSASENQKKSKFRHSGVDWLGEIPAHWQVKKLKYVAEINPESLSEKEDVDLEIEYIDISSVNGNGNIILTSNYFYSEAPSRARRIVKDGDTILSTVRTYLKAIAFIQNANDNLICSTGFAVIRPTEEFVGKFLFFIGRSKKFIERIMALSKGVSYPAIDSGDVKNIYVWVPLKEEQEMIVQHIEEEIEKVDATISKIEKEIDLLQEYRTALISEVVTGKVRVNQV